MGSNFGFIRKQTISGEIPPAFIALHGSDNVMVCCRGVRAGDIVTIDEIPVIMTRPIGIGHKIARVYLSVGDKVLRYNAPIGSMTKDAPIGSHIHTHNLKSDYIASHGRDAVNSKGEK